MSSSLDTLFDLVYESIPNCLFLIQHHFEYMVGLSDEELHKYVCTLCDYPIQLIYYLCTGVQPNYNEFSLVTNENIITETSNLLKEDNKILFVTFESKRVEEAHAYCYIVEEGNYYRVESSLHDFSTQKTETSNDKIVEELTYIFERAKSLRIKTMNLPTITSIYNRKKILDIMCEFQDNTPLREILLKNTNYNYYET